MTKSSHLRREFNKAGAMHAVIGVQSAVDDNTFLTKSGSVFQVLKVAGIDHEGRDPEQLETICRTFQSTLRFFGGGFRVLQYLVKTQSARIPFNQYPDNLVLQQAVLNQEAFFLTKSLLLFDVAIYFVVTLEGALAVSNRTRFFDHPTEWIKERFSTQRQAAILEGDLRQATTKLSQAVHSVTVQLEDSINAQLLGKQDAFAFLRSLVNFEPHNVGPGLKHDEFVDQQMCNSHMECHRDHLRLGGRYVKVLTLKDPPSKTYAHIIRQLSEIQSNMVVTSEWKPIGAEKARRTVNSMRRHYHNKKSSPMAYLNSTSAGPSDVLVDDSAVTTVNNLGQCLQEIDVNGNGFGEYSLTIVLHDDSADRLKRSVAECFKVFATHDAQLFEETYNLLNTFLAIIPGNELFNLRRLWLTQANHADLSFLFRGHSGDKINKQLNAEYLAVLETSDSSLYYFNLHFKDVAHALILGATGSGKSFLLNFLLTLLQKYSPRLFIFDLGGSYKSLTQMFGGSYLPIATENRPFTINPLSLPPTAENLQFLFSFLMVLITANGYQPTAADEKDLFEQLKNVYEIEPGQRRLLTLANTLNRNLRAQLQKWVHPGPFASLFDNVEDTLTFNRFQVFDFEGMSESPQMLEPLLFYILHRAYFSIVDESERSVFKVFAMDEVWRFLQHPTIRQYVLTAFKTWRMKNAAMIVATQSLDDLVQSQMINVVAECCPTKIFLANPGMDRAAYRSAFHLTETEADLIANLMPKRQFFMKRPDSAKVLNLEVDPKSYWLYTNDPKDNVKKREAFEKYGFEEGLNQLARSPK